MSKSEIVQRADLESRQSIALSVTMRSMIVQRADLESRQSGADGPSGATKLCKERIWNQGKAEARWTSRPSIVQRADLESRQSWFKTHDWAGDIVQRADLESRQSISLHRQRRGDIVQRADLESRQSDPAMRVTNRLLCKERIWNQGKAEKKHMSMSKRLCKERIWNQGKAFSLPTISPFLLCKERIWNQGKARRIVGVARCNCAKSGFGIKAKLESGRPAPERIVQRADLESRQSCKPRKYKLRRLCKERIWNQGKAANSASTSCADCAKSGFGIKAKQELWTTASEGIVQRADLESRQSWCCWRTLCS